MYVYLLHFDQPLDHAEHYSGSCRSIHARLKRHANGHGSRLTRHLCTLGIGWTLSRLWQTTQVNCRWAERHLKSQKNGPRYCPICDPFTRARLTGCHDFPLDDITATARLPLTSHDYARQPLPQIGTRLATVADEPFIDSVWKQDRDNLGFIPIGGPEGVRPLIQKSRVKIAELNGQRAGYVIFYERVAALGHTQVHQLAVDDQARLCGVGRALIDSLPRTPLIAKVRADLPAVDFWTANGFSEIDVTTHPTSGSTIIQFARPQHSQKVLLP